MNAERAELPMAVADCALEPGALREQADRYRRLGAAACVIKVDGERLLITFQSTVDRELVDATIATERRCCPFFALDYDASRRRLSISVADALRLDALDAVLSAIRAGAPTRSEG
jgi:hypothetical protein